jgi:calpain-7
LKSESSKINNEFFQEKAIQYYTEAVELIISIDDKEKREKLNKFAKQALDRAEELKGIKYQNIDTTTKRSVPIQNTASSTSSSTSRSITSPTIPTHNSQLEVIARQSYTMEEKKVLEKTSLINSRIYVPFMEVDTKERFNFPIPFSDKDGMLELAPKQKKEFQEWCRVSDLHDNPNIIIGSHADFYSIRQTVVSDCSFVASLSVAALYEKKFNRRILTSIIYPRNSKDEPVYNSSGKYSVKLHVNGIARKVIIDDYLPVGRHNQLLCSYSSNRSEFWVSLMEKAYLKLMGGYDFPGSNSNIDCYALTGWIPERITLRAKEPDFDLNGVFNRLKEGFHQGRCLITVATGELSDAECERTGLVSTHAFAVINLAEVDGVKLLMLKNPWSHLRWKGNYSEQDSAHWTPELQRALNYDPKQAQTVDNGCFWLDYNSLLNFFDVFYLNWDPELFKFTYCTHAAWNAGTGPARDAYNVGDNPQYSLSVPAGRGSVYVLLSRHITSIEDFRENKEYITLLVYNHKGGKRVYYPHDPAPFLDGIRINSPHYLCKIRLDPASARKYTLVVSQYEKSTTIFYTLRAYAREPFELKAINSSWATNIQVSGEWNAANLTAGGCQNHKTYKSNPLYKVTLANEGSLIVELRGPKVYQVGLEVTISSLEDPNITAPFISKTTETFKSGFCVMDLENLPAGVFNIRPSTYLPNQDGPFFLKLKSTAKLQIEKER